MKTKLLLNSFWVVLLVACQKEPDENLLDNNTTCRPDKIIYYDAGTPYDTVSYVYVNDRLMEVHYAYDGFLTALEYTGGLISKRNYVAGAGSSVFAFDKINYNPDSTLNSVQFYYVSNGLQFLFLEYEFTWSNRQLVSLLHKIDTSATGSGTVPYLQYTLTYTGDNITTVVAEDLFEQEIFTYNYTYDNNLNYYRQMPILLHTDNLFFSYDGSTLPFALSQNNVTGYSLDGGSSSLINLVPDANGGPKQLLENGEQVVQYFYKCQ